VNAARPFAAQPLVSVHVVTYNQRTFVAEALDSILAQDYPNLQIVVSDDASSDGTAEVISAFAARHPGRVIALTGGSNLGITGNGNKCLARCEGDYVAFLAGDDLMLPGKISAQVAWLEANPRRVLCAHDVEHFDSKSGRALHLHSAMARPRHGTGAAEFLRCGYFSATSSLMIRRSAMPARGFDERIKVHSDWKFAAECLVAGGSFGFVPGVYGKYRRHEGNATARHATLWWEELHMSIALLEAEYPGLVSACETARAYAYYQHAVSLIQRGSGDTGRLAIRNALRHYPMVSWKLFAWWALSFAPSSSLQRVTSLGRKLHVG
jgi:glycosyltransferase involved in cell wall biosynthesis